MPGMRAQRGASLPHRLFLMLALVLSTLVGLAVAMGFPPFDAGTAAAAVSPAAGGSDLADAGAAAASIVAPELEALLVFIAAFVGWIAYRARSARS